MLFGFLFIVIVFFFKQKTAYEMRISDWSSDVCSSDLVGAYLLLEPTEQSRVGARWRFGGKNELDAAFGLDAGDSLALLCSGKSGIGSALSSLANNCQLGAINGDDDSHHASATAALTRPGGRVGVQIGRAHV